MADTEKLLGRTMRKYCLEIKLDASLLRKKPRSLLTTNIDELLANGALCSLLKDGLDTLSSQTLETLSSQILAATPPPLAGFTSTFGHYNNFFKQDFFYSDTR